MPKRSHSKDDVRLLKEVRISLDNFEAQLATALGDGDLCLGIRRAVALAGLRTEADPRRIHTRMDDTADQLTIVTNKMAALAEELKHVGKDPSRRDKITLQIIKLGKLYSAIRAGSDLSESDL